MADAFCEELFLDKKGSFQVKRHVVQKIQLVLVSRSLWAIS